MPHRKIGEKVNLEVDVAAKYAAAATTPLEERRETSPCLCRMRNPMILVAIVAIMLAAIVVGLTFHDKADPTQLPRLGTGPAPQALQTFG